MKRVRTCIICEGPTGSREHVFPAALGGRRTNRGIYCAQHNEEYGPLANIIASQLQALNAFLGVRGDHADEPHSTTVVEQASGRPYRLSAARTEADPELLRQTLGENGETTFSMAFSSERQLQAWLEAQRTSGVQITKTKRSSTQTRHLSGGHVQLNLGGPGGLRAVAYVAQTFLAHHFPDIVRLPALRPFLQGTLRHQAWTGAAWWALEACDPELPPQSFDFGHRVLVGVDANSGNAYARVSLFSTLHYSVLFGDVAAAQSRTVVVDIDPLAEAPPRDIVEHSFARALDPVHAPESPTANLSDAIQSGRAQAAFSDLLNRITNHHLNATAAAILARAVADPPTGLQARRTFFTSVVDGESQRVLNLMRHVIEQVKALPAVAPLEATLALLVAPDPASSNGLTPSSTAALALAKGALVDQLVEDFASGNLTRDRIAMLIGGGPGAGIVGQAILQPVLNVLASKST